MKMIISYRKKYSIKEENIVIPNGLKTNCEPY